MDELTDRDLRLHIHNDVELLTMFPLTVTHGAEGYVMQENQVVYIGRLKGCEAYVHHHNELYCKPFYGIQI